MCSEQKGRPYIYSRAKIGKNKTAQIKNKVNQNVKSDRTRSATPIAAKFVLKTFLNIVE